MQVHWWEYHEVVGTLKPYHILKNLFELIALKDKGDGVALSPTASARARALVPPDETFSS